MRTKEEIKKELERIKTWPLISLTYVVQNTLEWALDKSERDLKKRCMEFANRLRKLEKDVEGYPLQDQDLRAEGATLLWLMGKDDVTGFSTDSQNHLY